MTAGKPTTAAQRSATRNKTDDYSDDSRVIPERKYTTKRNETAQTHTHTQKKPQRSASSHISTHLPPKRNQTKHAYHYSFMNCIPQESHSLPNRPALLHIYIFSWYLGTSDSFSLSKIDDEALQDKTIQTNHHKRTRSSMEYGYGQIDRSIDRTTIIFFAYVHTVSLTDRQTDPSIHPPVHPSTRHTSTYLYP